MSLFYKVSAKDLVESRNGVFLEFGLKALLDNGFSKSPFRGVWYGKDNMGGYEYNLCRLSAQSQLEMVFVYIMLGDRRIYSTLNIFKLSPFLSDINQLEGKDDMKFTISPNNKTEMDIPAQVMAPLWGNRSHKLKTFYTKNGFDKNLRNLSVNVARNFKNIDSFIIEWMNLYKPKLTTWEGDLIDESL